ncbi:hypothetical protein K3495_g2520 [Podosphaera aphanis]|nr:hypothetical protein K3495_g2520 [Podosphaera aphanis]
MYTPLVNLRGRPLSIAQIALVVAPSFILFGYDQVGIGGLLSLPDWVDTFSEIDTIHTSGDDRSQNATLQGLVVSTFVFGALFGCLGCMFLGDILGRRKSIFIAAIFSLIGQAICSTSTHLSQFIVGRSTIGTAIGILSSTVPVWQAECSPAAHRGKHVVLDGVFTTLGYALVSWINFGSSTITGIDRSITWRLPLAFPTIVSLLLLSSVFLMPESPRWLIKAGRIDEARETLSRLKDLPIDDPVLCAEVADIQATLDDSLARKVSLKDMFTMGPDKLFYRFWLCILLQFYQQMSGANLVSVYAPIIFEQNLGLGSRKAHILTGAALTWKFLSSFIAFFTIDRFGRRALFIFSGIGMGTCMMILTFTTAFPTSNSAASYASVAIIFMFNFFVPIGFLGANFLYCAEVAPVSLRVGMAAISTANHWLWNFVVVMATPVAIASIGHWYFLVFGIVGLSIPVVVFYFFPETMGRSLEEIDFIFRDNQTIRDIVKASIKSKPNATRDEENSNEKEKKKITS